MRGIKRSIFKKIGKWALRLFLLLCFLQLLQVLILAVPYPFFHERSEYKNYTLYSDGQIDPSIYRVIDNVDIRLEVVEINKPELNHRLFLCESEKLFRFYTFISGTDYPQQGFNVPALGNIFIYDKFIKKVHAANKGYEEVTQYSCVEGNMEEIIAHEIVHSLVYENLEYLESWSLPFWKSEGYAEYAANIAVVKKDTLYDLHKRIENLNDDSFWGADFGVLRHYYRSQILVEYLSEVKGLSFNDIMADDIKEEEVLQELNKWNN